MPSLC